MKTKTYFLDFDKAWKSEKIVRTFLLDNSTSVRFSKMRILNLGLSRSFAKQHKKFNQFLEKIKPDLISKTAKSAGKIFKKQTESHKYKLSRKLKSLINKETILFYINTAKFFYEFENPIFYKNGRKMGEVISHEPIITLYLTDSEKKLLKKKGIVFES